MNVQSSMVRLATTDDVPWLAAIIKGFYGDLIDIERCKDYFRATIDKPNHIYLRGEMSAVGAKFYLPFWAPLDSRPLASDIFFCPSLKERTAIFELVDLMKALNEWARKSGCRQLTFAALNSENIEAICRRAGAKEAIPCFRAVF